MCGVHACRSWLPLFECVYAMVCEGQTKHVTQKKRDALIFFIIQTYIIFSCLNVARLNGVSLVHYFMLHPQMQSFLTTVAALDTLCRFMA